MVFESETIKMTAPVFKVIDHVLHINNKAVLWNGYVMKCLPLGDRCVAKVGYLLPDKSKTPDANIFMLDADGQVVWQIEEFKEVKGRSSYYTNIWVDESGRLHAFNPLGFDCVIDIETGKIKSYEFTK